MCTCESRAHRHTRARDPFTSTVAEETHRAFFTPSRASIFARVLSAHSSRIVVKRSINPSRIRIASGN